MKQQYSLTSIWYWSLNSVAFIVATLKYLNALANLDQLLGTTSETFRNQVSS